MEIENGEEDVLREERVGGDSPLKVVIVAVGPS
ncbi:uncharacterized protein G2W53_000139 [Senna tora]|uniref:Uncharacterized protein n=1 Tax=Senna tora TaxID=362788 RepID=A0A834XDF8_9FABA|nr:uncharacterized protein G2W53_000139 [Senna tora]